MVPAIAVVGMACRYPDARSPQELWENVLAERRAFRRIPAERLCLDDYFAADRRAPDRTYSTEGAFIEGYEFDRARFRVAGDTFRSADLTHWLALSVAADALADAGWDEGRGLPRESTGVFIGNTLTGEFSRASLMRLRWPYVRRVLDKALEQEAWPPGQRRSFLARLEESYKRPFAPVGEETLAGGLSNTIAGRLCNYFDLNGGGYTLDGACASSLLAVINACAALAAGDIDVALAGGVDVSLDPFELVGFAKTGALAAERMRVYDARSAGFWPGEGCGLVVLMRHEEAVAQGRRVDAVIGGWGVSSDGSGGLTRPEVEGQLLALGRAYRRAGYGVETVTYFEGHGTGTSVGDAVELRALSRARREAGGGDPPPVVGSVKANIGHTKAAAGVAGLIKAVMALKTQVLPPTTGCEEPHEELRGEAPALRVLKQAELWPAERPLRAGVSAMGFGGINTHLTLEAAPEARRRSLNTREHCLASTAQDAELFLLGAPTAEGLSKQVEHLLCFSSRLSRSELTDLAARLAQEVGGEGRRAAVVASSPAELSGRLTTLRAWIDGGAATRLDIEEGVFLGAGGRRPRIGFLFPGQGAPAHLGGGAWCRRFEFVRELYRRARYGAAADGAATAVAQPAIVTASLAALRLLARLNITASVAVGHSLGELTALHWAGVFDEEALLRIAEVRGRAMAELGSRGGAMASIGAGRQQVEEMLNGDGVVIAGVNSPRQTVISGEAAAVAAVSERARAAGLSCVGLPVSRAFHSPLVAAAAPALDAHLAREEFRAPQRLVVSTLTGRVLTPETDLRELLCRQVTSPVRFMEAIATASGAGVDLWIEVGPGRTLRGLIRELDGAPAVALDAGGESLEGLLKAAGACFALHAPLDHAEAFAGRFTRPFDLDWRPRFFVNPCELAPSPGAGAPIGEAPGESTDAWDESERRGPAPPAASPEASPEASPVPSSALEVVRQLVAARIELPAATVGDDHRMLDELHLNSITVGQLVAEAARSLGRAVPLSPTEYANATVAEIARALEAGPQAAGDAEEEAEPRGVDSWVRCFTVELVERERPSPRAPVAPGAWRVIAPPGHPLEGALRGAFARLHAGSGLAVLLPPQPDESCLGLLLEGARLALAEKGPCRFVLVQHGGGAAAFARTLHQEAKHLTTCVVDVPPDMPTAVEWVVAEAAAAEGYTEAHYGPDGVRREPTLRPLPPEESEGSLPLSAEDVLLVTGGARGITAECVLALARTTGARLALFGLSASAPGGEIAANLERMRAAGVEARYWPVDVADAGAVRSAVREVEAELGPVTAIIHGAARNAPRLIADLDEETFLKTLAPKLKGASNLLAAVNPDSLRLFVAFGSIIARTGLPGEADYGLANEWLASLTERWQATHTRCRCLAIEWSIWSGVGMGARMGGVDALARQGITPISPDEGAAALLRLLGRPGGPTSVVVMGRFPELPTLAIERPELPFLRFLERPRVYYPRVELVADVELSPETDPYLDDHVFQGERIFPAVMGLEAMAQAVAALTSVSQPPVFEHVEFRRPVVVPGGGMRIRVAALARGPQRVEVVLRSAETQFQIDHFRALCRVGAASPAPVPPTPPCDDDDLAPGVSLDPQRDLYDRILFHRGRFRRVSKYRRLGATECVAEVSPGGSEGWFSRYLPGDLLLGDPGARDAAIHAIQACVPHETILPAGVERVTTDTAREGGRAVVRAREREHAGDTFIYDMEWRGEDGAVCERWEGLRLRVVSGGGRSGPWPEGLLAPYVERRAQELIGGAGVTVVFERDSGAGRRACSDRAIGRAAGNGAGVVRRYDGRPEVAGGLRVSASHAGDLTMAVAGPTALGCDIEPVAERPLPAWRDLLGERLNLAVLLGRETGDDLGAAATRVWNALECLKKAGAASGAPLALSAATPDGWVLLSSGEYTVASYIASIQGREARLALALLVRRCDAGL